eukprot:5748271-Amphidinium_carterae.1
MKPSAPKIPPKSRVGKKIGHNPRKTTFGESEEDWRKDKISGGGSAFLGSTSKCAKNHRPVSYTHLRAHETEADL